MKQPDKNEILSRIKKFYETMNAANPDWDTALIINNVNQYYFTGTMQDAVLVLKRSGEYIYFVRKSFDRALEQALIEKGRVRQMASYKDIADALGADLKNTYIEEETVPYAMLLRLQKYLNISKIGGIEALVKNIRSVKSEYELECMRESGKIHDRIMTDIVPKILVEGMSEADFAAAVINELFKNGFHGVSRFSAFQTETVGGQFAFGDGALISSAFNGPAGMRPYSPAVYAFASHERKLKKGDLVFADVVFGLYGYHTDKTQLYMFKGGVPQNVKSAHSKCIDILNDAARKMKTGAIPSAIYSDIISNIPEDFKTDFMGNGKSAVKFLGHGIGLVVDEFPVLAKGFDKPLETNTTMAVEPKKAIAGFGLVGVEETFAVTESGGQLLTGGAKDIIVIK